MTTPRPAIPRPMVRDVKTEAGHRCAIPTCRQPVGLQIHHIVDYAKVQEHTFDNLILLCANCHSRVTSGEIDTLSVKRYKTNLAVVSLRYSEFERRVLTWFIDNGLDQNLELPGGDNHLTLAYLLRDRLLEPNPEYEKLFSVLHGREMPERESFCLTGAGKEFARRWTHAEEVE